MGEITRGESNLLADLNEFVRQTSDLLEDEPQTTGIRPNPVIEVTETTLDTTRFGFEFGPQPEAQVEPGGAPPPPEPPPTCPPTNPCTLDFSVSSEVWNPAQTGLDMQTFPNPCDAYGWVGEWETNCGMNSCGQINRICNNEDASCVCGIRLEWIEDTGSPTTDPSRLRIYLSKIVGDSILDDGWYCYVNLNYQRPEGSFCEWQGPSSCVDPPGCPCFYIGDLSVFDTEFEVELPLALNPFSPHCSSDATLTLHFYPC